ncbi:hypothetical protein CTN01_12215 [Photobacterium angustum]|nr:hypothetical protein CTN01_12215 [Photobacterium angustum]
MNNKPNKAFKTDSQRLAFCTLGWVKYLRCKGLGKIAGVAHYLTRRLAYRARNDENIIFGRSTDPLL